MSRATILRLGLILALVSVWLGLRAVRPEWAAILSTPVVNMGVDYGWRVPAAGGGLLALFLASLLWTAYGGKHRRGRAGDDAAGLGCVTMTAWLVGAVLLTLAAGVVLGWYGLVNVISFVMMVLTVIWVPQLVWEKWREWRRGSSSRRA